MAFNNLVDITRLQYFLEKLKALIPSASSAAPGKIASSSSQGSSTNYARQDHTHGIDLATGDSNGQVKIAGSNVSVKGLAALAYKASLGKSDVGLGNVDNVKQYSASNPPPYPVTSVNGSTGAVTVSVPSAATINPKMDGTAAVGTSAKYAKEDHVHPRDTTRAASVHTHSTQDLIRPSALRGLADNTLQTLVSTTRANRLAFLPADQIIIEKTTDGGVTWVDAGVSDANKIALFSETRPSIYLPLLNGVRSLLCGLRITITAMKYDVPSGTSETDKYNYWSETYLKSAERYCELKELYFWLSSVNDTIGVKVERATGKAPNNWISAFDDSTFYMAGWSGCNYLRFGQNVFGGTTTQTTNYWNYRITLMTKGVNGTDTLATSYTTSSQTIMEIRGYGDTVWTVANQFMANDHLYNKDSSQNAIFPANVTASKFIGNLQGNADSATNASKVNNHTVGTDVPANAVFTDTTYESKAAASGGTDVSLVTTGEKYIWNTRELPSGGSAGQVLKKSSATDYSVEWGDTSGAQMVVAVTRSGSTVSANKSFSELYSAYQNGSQIIAFYGSEQNVYMLNKVSSSLIEFAFTDVSSSGTTQYLIRITSSNVVNVYQTYIPSPPEHANSNPIFVIYLDETETPLRYRIDFSQYDDISYFFGTDASTPKRWDLVTLQLWNSGKNSYADPIENADYDEFKLTHAYTTSSMDEYDNVSYVGHLVFSAIVIENGQKKLKTFELVSNFNTYEYLDDATITYSEEILGGGGSMPVNAAVIHVNAPLGSAITFFKDSTVMEAVTAAQTHPNADGKTEDYYYSVPTSDFGSWTVVASKSGENDATQSFSVLVAKQYDAILSYMAPYDFQAIEWLQTSAAPCYFDTGIDVTTNTIQTEVYCETVGYSQDYDLTLFGTALGYAAMANGYRHRWSFSYCTSNDTTWEQLSTYTYTEGTDYHLIYNTLGGAINLDDVNVAGSRNRLPKNTNYPRLYIGRYYNPSNQNYYYGQWRYKRFIVSDTSTGEILADFQPCYRKADHVIGFWDHVSNAFFVNLGTGTLTAGPDI